MSRRGNCWDNAVAESFFSALKLELVADERFKNRHQARDSIFEYIEVFYNRDFADLSDNVKLHSLNCEMNLSEIYQDINFATETEDEFHICYDGLLMSERGITFETTDA